MKFADFKNQYQHQPYFLARDLIAASENPQSLLNQLSRWQKKGLIIAIRKGIYVLNEYDRKQDIDLNCLANICYEPSYVSLQSALNFYGLIPERVTDITSVTTRKTADFNNPFGHFVYQHIKQVAFRGFTRIQQGSTSFFMAQPEKAVVDFLYLNLSRFDKNSNDVLEQSYRFQNIEDLHSERLIQMGKLFKNKKLMRIIKELCRWIKEQQHD